MWIVVAYVRNDEVPIHWCWQNECRHLARTTSAAVSLQLHVHSNTAPSFAKIGDQIFNYTNNIGISWKTLLISRLNCTAKLKLRWKGNIQITWIRCSVINMSCNGIVILNKFVMCLVVIFCQNTSSLIERVRNSGFGKLSSGTVLEDPKVRLCPSLNNSESVLFAPTP